MTLLADAPTDTLVAPPHQPVGSPHIDLSAPPQPTGGEQIQAAAPAPAPERATIESYALELGLSRVLTGRGEFRAFVVTDRAGEREIHEFPNERPARSRQAAVRHLRALTERPGHGIARAAIVWDSYVTCLDRRVEAIVVEHCAVADPESTVIARRYRRGSMFRAGSPVGPVLHEGEGHPLF